MTSDDSSSSPSVGAASRWLMISQVYPPDPAAVGQYLGSAAAELVRRGVEVRVLTANRGYDDPSQVFAASEQREGVAVRRLPGSSFGKRSLFHRAAGMLSFLGQATLRGLVGPKPDGVLVSTSPPLAGLAGWVISVVRGVPLVWWVMDLNPDQAVASGKLRAGSAGVRFADWVNRRVLRRAVRVIALDEFMAERLRAKVPECADRVAVLPLWPLENLGERTPPDETAFRRKHGLVGKFVVMYAGNHSAVHPLDTVLGAADERFGGRCPVEPSVEGESGGAERAGSEGAGEREREGSEGVSERELGGGQAFAPEGRAEGSATVPQATSDTRSTSAQTSALGTTRSTSEGRVEGAERAGSEGLRERELGRGQAEPLVEGGSLSGEAGEGGTRCPQRVEAEARERVRHGGGYISETGASDAEAVGGAEWVFVFVGGGVGKEAVERFKRERGAANVVSLPYVPLAELGDTLSAADVQVVSMGDAMVGKVHPCKFLGAFALGIPILYVGPERSHIAEFVGPGVAAPAGWGVRHGDVAGAVAALQEAAGDPAERAKRGAQGRAVVEGTRSEAALRARFVEEVKEAS